MTKVKTSKPAVAKKDSTRSYLKRYWQLYLLLSLPLLYLLVLTPIYVPTQWAASFKNGIEEPPRRSIAIFTRHWVFVLICVLISIICVVPMINLLAKSLSSTDSTIVGLIPGRVIFHILRKRPAPSTEAAS